MPDSLLRILNVCLLALLLLFFFRVLRAVWVQVKVPDVAVPVAPRGEPAGRASPVPAQVRSPRTAGAFQLRVVEPGESRGHTYDVADEVTLGRSPGCGVSIPDTTVSQLHARLFRRDDDLWLEDLGSTNGTWVNGARIGAPVPLRRNDRVQVGGTILEVVR